MATIRSTGVRFEINFPQDLLRASTTLSVAILSSDPSTGESAVVEVRCSLDLPLVLRVIVNIYVFAVFFPSPGS